MDELYQITDDDVNKLIKQTVITRDKARELLIKNKPQILSMNLGTGSGTSVLELISVFEKINGVKIPYHFSKRREGDNAFVVADNSLAKSILNWEPKRSIEEICIDGWNWQQKNPNGYLK